MFKLFNTASIANVAKLFGALILFFVFSACQDVTLENPDDGVRESNKKSITVDHFLLTASHGKKRIVDLHWDYVPDAARYEIYQSESPYWENDSETDGFELIKRFHAVNYETDKASGTTKKTFNTSYSVAVESGAAYYYKVLAYSATEGGYLVDTSNVVLGTSLARPVLSIATTERVATVTWFMDNCSYETYRNKVLFEVSCYRDKDGNDEVGAPRVFKGTDFDDDFSIKYTGLDSGVEYYFKVTSYLNNDQSATEIGGPDSKNTAKSITPTGVQNLDATRGTIVDAIKVSWKFPAFTNIRNKGNNSGDSKDNFSKRPIYFVLERKESGQSDSYYQKIAPYIGCIRGDNFSQSAYKSPELGAGEYQFYCGKLADKSADAAKGESCYVGKSANSKGSIEVICGDNTDTEVNDSSYPGYVVGSTITYTDTDVDRSKCYEYRVTTHTDDSSANTACLSTDRKVTIGFRTNITKLNIVGIPDNRGEDPDNKEIKTWDVSFDLKMSDTFAEKCLQSFNEAHSDVLTMPRYYFALAERLSKIDGNGNKSAPGPWKFLKFGTEGAINKFTMTYDVEHNKDIFGYYEYRVVVLGDGVNIGDFDATNADTLVGATDVGSIKFAENKDAKGVRVAYEFVNSSGSVCVVDSTKYLPSVNVFKIKDGFKDKFQVTFEYNPEYRYILYHRPATSKDESDFVVSCDIAQNSIPANEVSTVDGKSCYTLNDKAQSGDAWEYKLMVQSGIEINVVRTDINKGDDPAVMTLGTAKPTQDGCDYDAIKISCERPQKSDVDTLELCYDGETTNLASGATATNDNGVLTWTISKPAGYTDAMKAGKRLVAKVTSKNNITDDTTVGIKSDCYIAGPAMLDLKVLVPELRKIRLQWNAVPWTKTYAVYRVPYIDNVGTTLTATNRLEGNALVYYITKPEGSRYCTVTPSVAGNASSCVAATYSGNEKAGTIIFEDTYKDYNNPNDTSDAFLTLQRRLVFGLPYSYTVVPVLNDGDAKFNVQRDEDDPKNKGILTVGVQNTSDSASTAINYTNIKNLSATSATFGCGINLRAAKLESNTAIKVEWDKPYWCALKELPEGFEDALPSSYNVPHVFRRTNYGNHPGWYRRSLSADDPTRTPVYVDKFEDTNHDKANGKTYPYEYFVAYGTDENPVNSYVEYLANIKETRYKYDNDADIEPQNVGYLNKLPDDFIEYLKTASDKEISSYYDPATQYYAEAIKLRSWDIVARKLHPTRYLIGIKNYNLDGQFHNVYKLDWAGNGNWTLSEVADDDENKAGAVKYDVFATNVAKGRTYNDQVWLSPRAIYNTAKKSDNTTEGGRGTTPNTGVLKVLRDYRHYYQVSSQYIVTEDEDERVVSTDELYAKLDDNGESNKVGSFYTYRQITDEELVKATMLIIGDATQGLYSGDGSGTSGLDLGNDKTWKNVSTNSYTGGESFRWAQNMASKFFWNITGYRHKWTSSNAPCNQADYSAFIVLDNIDSGRVAGRRQGYIADSWWKWLSWHDGGNASEMPDYSDGATDDLIPIRTQGYGDVAGLDSYTATVWLKEKGYDGCNAKLKVSRGQAVNKDTNQSTLTYNFSITDLNDKESVLMWSPIHLNDYPNVLKDPKYGWWPN